MTNDQLFIEKLAIADDAIKRCASAHNGNIDAVTLKYCQRQLEYAREKLIQASELLRPPSNGKAV